MWAKIQDFRIKHPIWATLIAIALTAVALVWLILFFLDFWTHHGDDATVPEVKNMQYTEASDILRRADLGIEIADSIYDTSIPAGTIVESWPKAGSQVKRGRNVYVTITAFSPKHVTISMPITGVSVRQAISYLNALGITGIRQVSVPSQYPDLVESAHAGGRPIGVGSIIPVDSEVLLEVGTYYEPEPADSTDVDYEALDVPETGLSTYTLEDD